MGSVRPPAVAGKFYPADPTTLAGQVDDLLTEARRAARQGAPGHGNAGDGGAVGDGNAEDDRGAADGARAFVVPHAGYIYSGPTAAHAYAAMPAGVRRIVLIGPSHFAPLRGCAVATAGAWRTPLGEVTVDADGAAALVDAGLVTVDDDAHGREHSLEVQLPFLQRVLPGGTPVLPVVVGNAAASEVAAVIGAALSPGSVLLCSTDLSHYETDERARVQDAATLRAVLGLRSQDLGVHDACGVFALRGLVDWAAAAGVTPRLLHYGTSADTAGDPSRVVGYAALALM